VAGVAPVGRVDAVLFGQDNGPVVGNDRQKFQHIPPVIGIFGGRQVMQIGEIQPFRLHLVQQPRQFAGQPHCLVGGYFRFRFPAQDHTGQQQGPSHFGDGGRQGQGRVAGRQVEGQRLLVHIAQRLNRRQNQRLALANTQERLAQRPAGAPRRQQDQVFRQDIRLAAGLGQQPRRQRVQERPARRDGQDTGGIAHRESPAKAISAAASSSGVPT
jgi:hypothetical protein